MIWAVWVLVAATLVLKSRTGQDHTVGVAGRLRADDVGECDHVRTTLTRATRMAASVSALSPDWVMPITMSPGPARHVR